jgi:hypothetical protein
MRRGAALAIVGAALLAVPAAHALKPPNDRVLVMINEAKRLELQALDLFKANTADPQADTLVQQSLDLLQQAQQIGRFTYASRLPVHGAAGSDTMFLRHHKAGNMESALQQLEIAIALKDVAVARLEEDEWPKEKVSSKRTPPYGVPAPTCRRLQHAERAFCSGTAYWDVNVDAKAKRARCVFTGPAGQTDTMRPLFAGTLEITTCKLTNKFRMVGGERKRIVHATLTISAPDSTSIKGSKPVSVTAYWQTSG